MVSDIIRPADDDRFFTAGPAEYEDVKARFLEDGSTWAPQHAADVEVLLTEVTRRALQDSGESFDAALGKMLGEAYSGRFVEHLETLEAIVRDLAAAGATFMQVRERAKAWVSAHPVPGDQPERTKR